MPQMKPLNWLYLFILFSIIILIMNLINFFIYSLNSPLIYKNTHKTYKNMFWKW